MERGFFFFSTVLKQKQRKQRPNFTLKERPKDSWHSYFRVSCSTLLILQALPMENMEQKAVFPSRRVSVSKQASMSSRNQSTKEHQGLFCVTLGVCVQDPDLWHLMAPRGASHHGIHTSKTEGQPLPFPAVSLTRTERHSSRKLRPKTGRDQHSPRIPWQMPREECLQKPFSTMFPNADHGKGNSAANQEIKENQ